MYCTCCGYPFCCWPCGLSVNSLAPLFSMSLHLHCAILILYPPKLVLLKVLSLVSTAFTFLWTLELMSQYFDCNLYNTGFLVLVIFRLPVTVVFLNVHTGRWRDGSVVGRACCFFRGPELSSRQPCLPTPNQPFVSPVPGLPLLASEGIAHTYGNIHTNKSKYWKNIHTDIHA